MSLKVNLLKTYKFLIDLIIGVALAVLVFNFPVTAYELGQSAGPKIGKALFELIHPDPLGKMVYTK